MDVMRFINMGAEGTLINDARELFYPYRLAPRGTGSDFEHCNLE